MIVSDHGTRLTSDAILEWSHRPRKADVEWLSFNGRTRDWLLNESLFFGVDHARCATAEGRQDFNNARLHLISHQTRSPSPRPLPQAAPMLRSMQASRLRQLLKPPPTEQQKRP